MDMVTDKSHRIGISVCNVELANERHRSVVRGDSDPQHTYLPTVTPMSTTLSSTSATFLAGTSEI